MQENLMSNRKVYSGSCGTLTSLEAWTQFSGTDRREIWREELHEIERKEQSFCRSIRRCRRGHRITSRSLAHVKKNCKCSVKRWRNGRRLSRRASIGETVDVAWKLRSRPCRQERKEEVRARHSPMDAALIQPSWSVFSRSEQHWVLQQLAFMD